MMGAVVSEKCEQISGMTLIRGLAYKQLPPLSESSGTVPLEI
jgi:hypothetical protein